MPAEICGKCLYGVGVNIPIYHFDKKGVLERLVWINVNAKDLDAQKKLGEIIQALYKKHPNPDELRGAVENALEEHKKLLAPDSRVVYEWDAKKDTGKCWPKGQPKPAIPPQPTKK